MYWFSENGEIASKAQTWPKCFHFLRWALHSVIARGQTPRSSGYISESEEKAWTKTCQERVMFCRPISGLSTTEVRKHPLSTTVWISHHHKLPKKEIVSSHPNQSTYHCPFSQSLSLNGKFQMLRNRPCAPPSLGTLPAQSDAPWFQNRLWWWELSSWLLHLSTRQAVHHLSALFYLQNGNLSKLHHLWHCCKKNSFSDKMNQAEWQYGICGRNTFLTLYFKTLDAADISK